jgi:predicted nucleic acid-binding protein
VAVAIRLGLPLVTWDREQALRAASRIPVLTPEEYR